ncbi:hypothetical protein EES40_36210 [Streptomyces sp. ADI93-02]|nr:hypothetical protein EES40_36210 [Streptomyces sp. ADI93-02]
MLRFLTVVRGCKSANAVHRFAVAGAGSPPARHRVRLRCAAVPVRFVKRGRLVADSRESVDTSAASRDSDGRTIPRCRTNRARSLGAVPNQPAHVIGARRCIEQHGLIRPAVAL